MQSNKLARFFSIPILLCAIWYAAEERTVAAVNATASSDERAATADSARSQVSAHPALWVQAVKISESSKDLVPGKVIQKIQELDNDGRVKSETDVESSLSLDEAGKIKSNIIRASKDGKDITEKEKKEAEETAKKEAAKKEAKSDSDEHSHSFSLQDTPFNPEIQGDVRVTETKSRDTIDGRSCICFEYSYPEKRKAGSKAKPVTVSGKAWIDESSGCPAKLEFTTDPLPKHVKSMLTTLRYDADGNGSWVLRQMVFEVRGSFLFFGKRMRGDILFSDYWKYEEPASAK